MKASAPSSASSLLLLILTWSSYNNNCLVPAQAFAAAKTKSSNKKNKANKSTGGGFGAPTKAPPSYQADTCSETVQLLQFLTFQNAKGLKDVEIGIANDNGLRGLYATRNFKQGKMLCQIPSDCALALSDPSATTDTAPTLVHGGANFLSLYWNNEQAQQLWAPYLNTLPTPDSPQFDPTPDFFTEEQLQRLEFPRIIQQATQRKQDIETLAKEQGLDPEQLQFATWLTGSRAFPISISQQDEAKPDEENEQALPNAKAQSKTLRVMVPFIDMANHNSDQPNAKLTIIDPEKDDAWFALQATRPIKAGKEITIAYGSGVESSVELLQNYGFTPSRNKMDEFMLQKGGDDTIATMDEWSTTLQQDKTMLDNMTEETRDAILEKILNFRIRLKEAYPQE